MTYCLLVGLMNLPRFYDLTCLATTLELLKEGFFFLPAHIAVAVIVAFASHGLHAFLLVPCNNAVHACCMDTHNPPHLIAAHTVQRLQLQCQQSTVHMSRIGTLLCYSDFSLFGFAKLRSFYVHLHSLISLRMSTNSIRQNISP